MVGMLGGVPVPPTFAVLLPQCYRTGVSSRQSIDLSLYRILPGDVAAVSLTAEKLDAAAGPGQRFYRVLAVGGWEP